MQSSNRHCRRYHELDHQARIPHRLAIRRLGHNELVRALLRSKGGGPDSGSPSLAHDIPLRPRGLLGFPPGMNLLDKCVPSRTVVGCGCVCPEKKSWWYTVAVQRPWSQGGCCRRPVVLTTR